MTKAARSHIGLVSMSTQCMLSSDQHWQLSALHRPCWTSLHHLVSLVSFAGAEHLARLQGLLETRYHPSSDAWIIAWTLSRYFPYMEWLHGRCSAHCPVSWRTEGGETFWIQTPSMTTPYLTTVQRDKFQVLMSSPDVLKDKVVAAHAHGLILHSRRDTLT